MGFRLRLFLGFPVGMTGNGGGFRRALGLSGSALGSWPTNRRFLNLLLSPLGGVKAEAFLGLPARAQMSLRWFSPVVAAAS